MGPPVPPPKKKKIITVHFLDVISLIDALLLCFFQLTRDLNDYVTVEMNPVSGRQMAAEAEEPNMVLSGRYQNAVTGASFLDFDPDG